MKPIFRIKYRHDIDLRKNCVDPLLCSRKEALNLRQHGQDGEIFWVWRMAIQGHQYWWVLEADQCLT